MATHLPTNNPSGMAREPALSRDALVGAYGDSYILPTHHEDVEPKHGMHFATSPKAAWDRFNGRGRKRVGFLQSAKAVALSSCMSIPPSPPILSKLTSDPQT